MSIIRLLGRKRDEPQKVKQTNSNDVNSMYINLLNEIPKDYDRVARASAQRKLNDFVEHTKGYRSVFELFNGLYALTIPISHHGLVAGSCVVVLFDHLFKYKTCYILERIVGDYILIDCDVSEVTATYDERNYEYNVGVKIDSIKHNADYHNRNLCYTAQICTISNVANIDTACSVFKNDYDNQLLRFYIAETFLEEFENCINAIHNSDKKYGKIDVDEYEVNLLGTYRSYEAMYNGDMSFESRLTYKPTMNLVTVSTSKFSNEVSSALVPRILANARYYGTFIHPKVVQ